MSGAGAPPAKEISPLSSRGSQPAAALPQAASSELSTSQPGAEVVVGNGNGSYAGKGMSESTYESNQALWEEVGLELNGVHNYDPACLELDRTELMALNDEFLAHRKLFGFQQDNVRSQMEHVCFLIQNARDRYGANAYQYLHNRSVERETEREKTRGSEFRFV
jgi:hypothetical protein